MQPNHKHLETPSRRHQPLMCMYYLSPHLSKPHKFAQHTEAARKLKSNEQRSNRHLLLVKPPRQSRQQSIAHITSKMQSTSRSPPQSPSCTQPVNPNIIAEFSYWRCQESHLTTMKRKWIIILFRLSPSDTSSLKYRIGIALNIHTHGVVAPNVEPVRVEVNTQVS